MLTPALDCAQPIVPFWGYPLTVHLNMDQVDVHVEFRTEVHFQNDTESDIAASPRYTNSQYVNFQYSSAHHNSPLGEQPDTEYMAIIVVVVIFVVLFISVNLVLDFFGVWFWVAFAAAFVNLLLCMWLMCGPGCKDPLVLLRPQQSCPAILGDAFQRRDSRGRRSEEGGNEEEASSQEINEEEGRTASPSALITTPSAPSPSPVNYDPNLDQIQFEPPPSYQEALSMKVQEEIKLE